MPYKAKNFCYILFSFFLGVNHVYGQLSEVNFGKNRVQYKGFKWQYYETENFRIYFYQGGQDLGKYVIFSSEKCLKEVSTLLNNRLSNMIDIIVYQDISDMHQTNIGIEESIESISSTIQIKNNKLFVYFDGRHEHLDQQIKEGISRILVSKINNATGFKKIMQGNFMANLPVWYSEGLVAYCSKTWDAYSENHLREKIINGKFNNLNKLNRDDLIFVGRSIWQHIEHQFGKEAIGNLLYLTRTNRSLDDGFLFATGKSLNQFVSDWYMYNKNKFKAEASLLDEVDEDLFEHIKKPKGYEIYQSKLSPNGKYIAYAINEIGRWKVIVFNTSTQESQVILKGGFRTNMLETDLSTPMLAWEPRGKKLSVIYERKDEFYLQHYLSDDFKKEGKPSPMPKLQKIFDFSYAGDSRNILLSAMKNSQIDIFKYYIPSTRLNQLTNDFYDDLQVSYFASKGRKGALFISNRPNDNKIHSRIDTILPNGTFDVYFYDFNNSIQTLSQLSFTPLANESYPQAFYDSSYTFLSEIDGINSQYVGNLTYNQVEEKVKYKYKTHQRFFEVDSMVVDLSISLDSAIACCETVKEVVSVDTIPIFKLQGKNNLFVKYSEGLTELNVKPNIAQELLLMEHNDKTELVSLKAVESNNPKSDTSEYVIKKIEDQIAHQKKVKELAEKQKNANQTIAKLDKTITYQSKFDDWQELVEEYQNSLSPLNMQEEEEDYKYKFSRTRQYFLKFKTEDVSFDLSNSLLVTSYQAFDPGNPVFNQPSINAMISFGITDLFEDHKIQGGFRVPGNFKGSEIFLRYVNYKKRWDKSILYYRKASTQTTDMYRFGLSGLEGKVSNRTNIIQGTFRYPFNNLNSISLNPGFRNERFIPKSTDYQTLNAKNVSQNWLYLRTEYIHDHTLPLADNIYKGFRFNGYFEIQKEFPTRAREVGEQSIQLPVFDNSYFMLWGFDARHYLQVFKSIVWANRLAYSTSVGTKKMVYYLGGTSGLIAPKFNTATVVDTNRNYAFQSLAVNMHGFQQNIRNGNSFMVWNSEFRVPIFSAFSLRPIRSAFIRNFQIVNFIDVGTAWKGFSPFGSANIAKEIRQNAEINPTAVAIVDIHKQPVVFGFGFGFRTELLGYFLRADIGWGYDTGKVNKARFQFSFGYDF